MKNYKQGILYLFFGALTTAVNIISYYASYNIFKISNVTSTILAWALAVLFAFVTNRIFVFESKNPKIFKEMMSFFSARLVTLLLDMGTMFVLATLLQINYNFSKIIAMVLVTVGNYVISKVFVFKKGK